VTKPTRDVEDNYESYLDDELGYAWGVWDRTTLAEIARHDAILEATGDELRSTDPAGLDDLQRLALARAARRSGDLEGELDALRLIATPPMEHPGVDYIDVVDLLSSRLCDAQLFDEAEHFIDRLEAEEWCEVTREYTRALVALASDRSLGRSAFEEILRNSPDDPELRYDIAEDLARYGQLDTAHELLDEAELVATRTGIDAVLVDIELLRATIGAKANESQSTASPVGTPEDAPESAPAPSGSPDVVE
jgi:thioredoxin-like negative regulator of GroEL